MICFLCDWIRRDLEDHGKLTGWPHDYVGASIFPVQAKTAHMELEGYEKFLDVLEAGTEPSVE